MKVLILAGGLGTRLSEETDIRPKPMIEIGGKPILWHIMKNYSHYGFNEFVILLGYKGYLIKEYFANYYLHQSNITCDLSTNSIEIHNNANEAWKVTLLDTGINSMTGGRILLARPFVGDETFMLTYGDGVSDININRLITFHQNHGKVLTMTTVQPEGRFGAVDLAEDCKVEGFFEKPKGDRSWVNGGYFVCNTDIFDYLNDGDQTILERTPLENLAQEGELYAYKHHGFWKCMDTRSEEHTSELQSH